MQAIPTDSRARLDRPAVVATAMELADTEGLDALTIRRLAKELGVTPTALYWHFADKQALLDALADQLWADARDLLGAAGAVEVWAELRSMFEALVAVFRRHPSLAALAPSRALESPAGLAVTERALELLAQVGYDDPQAADAATFMLCTAIMLVTSRPGSALADEGEREALMRQKRAMLLTLPPRRYPRVEAAADALVNCDEPESYFTLGIDLIVSGLRANAPAAADPRPRSG